MSFDVLRDRYKIDSVLGQSIGKRSLKALDLHTNQPVLIRAYDLSYPLNQERLGRFQRQAALLKQLNHPRIPTLLESIQSDGYFVLVSQFVPGQNLADILAAGWLPQEKDCLQLAEQVLQILSYLQHYNPPALSFDLRPHKLIMDSLERIWLADLGGLQHANPLYGLANTLVQLLTGREPDQLPRVKDRPAFHSFVSISNDFARWLDILLEPSEKRGFGTADKALEMLWKLQGKTWEPPISSQPRPQIAAPERAVVQGPWPLETVLAGQYRLRLLLGKGQGTWKYAGYDQRLKQDVVLKVIPLPQGQGQDWLLPYQQQVQTLQGLNHPQIPRLLKAFALEQEDQNYWVMVSVLVAGQTLKDKFEAGWRPASAELWDIARQVLKILDFIHTRRPARGHGNLNPSNLVVNNFGRIWLVDFGLIPASPATDLYDLAASLIFLLTGSQPGEFLAGGQSYRLADGVECPESIKQWLRRLLQADPTHPVHTVAEALGGLEEALLNLAQATAALPETRPVRSVIVKQKAGAVPLSWEARAQQLAALRLHCEVLTGGGIELYCPESKELAQWGRSKTIGLLFSPLSLLEENQEKSRQGSKLFPLSGHRLDLTPEGVKLLKGENASGEKEILDQSWSQLLQIRLGPVPAKLLEALKNKVPPPSGTGFRLFHLMMANKSQNCHCLLFLPPKAVPSLTQLFNQYL